MPVLHAYPDSFDLPKPNFLHVAFTKGGEIGVVCRGFRVLPVSDGACCQEKFYLGFTECMDEVMRFLVEKKGYNASDTICVDLLSHLKEHNKKFRPRKLIRFSLSTTLS